MVGPVPEGSSGGAPSDGRATPSRKERGVLRTKLQKGSRPGVALLMCGAVLIVPLLLLQGGADASASVARGAHRAQTRPATAPGRARPALNPTSSVKRPAAAVREAVRGAPAPATASTPASTPATTPAPDPTTTAPAPTAAPSTTTTTMVAPTTTTVPAASPLAAASGSEGTGQVTYYAHPAGGCASPWLPFGTVVRVTNPANGESVDCVVNDREADSERSIDLATATFA